jgi:hypothetical protein
MLFSVAYSFPLEKGQKPRNYYNCIILEDLVTAIGDHIAMIWKNHIAVNFSFFIR